MHKGNIWSNLGAQDTICAAVFFIQYNSFGEQKSKELGQGIKVSMSQKHVLQLIRIPS